MAVSELTIDLNDAPEERWEQLVTWRGVARELLEFYVRDIGGLESFGPFLREYRDSYVDAEYIAEMRGVARVLDASEDEVVLANLYYDAIKLVLAGGIGCTAFAVDTQFGPVHARNLDWTSANGRLASESVIMNFRRGEGVPLYRTIGWPGFVGCLSGVAPGRFAVTLNAVMSEDAPELAPPITFVLRHILEHAETFDAALAALRDTTVASDSLLLLSGVRPGEMAVIERAPTRAAVRAPHRGAVLVANDYRALRASPRAATLGSALFATSCGRYERAAELVSREAPQDVDSCLSVLRDPRVKMSSTVQHLVLSAADGAITVALPS